MADDKSGEITPFSHDEETRTVEPEVIGPGEFNGAHEGRSGLRISSGKIGLKPRLILSVILLTAGAAAVIFGSILTVTIIGAFLGIPLILLGLSMIFLAVRIPFTKNRFFIAGNLYKRR